MSSICRIDSDPVATSPAVLARFQQVRVKELDRLARAGLQSEEAKREFHNLARRSLRELGQHLRLLNTEYDLRYHLGQSAQLGESILACDFLYVSMGWSLANNGVTVLFRHNYSRRDFGLGTCHYTVAADVVQPERLVSRIKAIPTFFAVVTDARRRKLEGLGLIQPRWNSESSASTFWGRVANNKKHASSAARRCTEVIK